MIKSIESAVRPRYLLYLVGFLIAACLVVTCITNQPRQSCAAEDAPALRGKLYTSPAEVFEAYRTARDKRDWPTVFDCLSKGAQDGEIMGLIYSCWMQSGNAKALAVIRKHGVGEQAVNDEYSRRYKKKHGVDISELDATQLPPEDIGLEIEVFADLKLNRLRFFAEASEALDSEWTPRLDKLREIVVQGDTASAVSNQHTLSLITTQGGGFRKIPETYELEFHFRKVGAGWYIDDPNLGRRMQ